MESKVFDSHWGNNPCNLVNINSLDAKDDYTVAQCCNGAMFVAFKHVFD